MFKKSERYYYKTKTSPVNLLRGKAEPISECLYIGLSNENHHLFKKINSNMEFDEIDYIKSYVVKNDDLDELSKYSNDKDSLEKILIYEKKIIDVISKIKDNSGRSSTITFLELSTLVESAKRIVYMDEKIEQLNNTISNL